MLGLGSKYGQPKSLFDTDTSFSSLTPTCSPLANLYILAGWSNGGEDEAPPFGNRMIFRQWPKLEPRPYYHYDALGSTVNLTTDQGTVQVSYQLDPWGHIRNQSGTTLNRQIFTGQEHDENTGLIYFGARYYDPDTARFINQDSYLGEPGTPPSLHRYLYAYSNPTVWVDLYGNSSSPFQMMWNDLRAAEKINYPISLVFFAVFFVKATVT